MDTTPGVVIKTGRGAWGIVPGLEFCNIEVFRGVIGHGHLSFQASFFNEGKITYQNHGVRGR